MSLSEQLSPLPRAWRTAREVNTPIVEETKDRTPFEDTLCQMAGHVLQKHYPGFTWAVRVNEANGMFYVLNQDLSGEWGYRGKVGAIFSSSDFEREILMAGGGILEHFGLARAAANQDKLVALPTDYAGRTLLAGRSDRVFNKRETFRTK